MTPSLALERGRYPIPSLAAHQAGAAFATRAEFNGYVVCVNPPRARVEALLPPELRLADRDGSDAGQHPLLFVFGEQTRCAMTVGGVEIERDIAYDELGVLVPFVSHRRVRQLCVYVPGMATSYYLSNWTGKVHYGYGKRLARMHSRPPLYAVTTSEHGLAFRALVATGGAWLGADEPELSASLSTLQAIASLPWVGRKPNGLFVRSWSDWGFAKARLRRVEPRCTVYAPLVDALATGEYPALAGCSFEVRGMTWWLSWPQACPF